jgi:hypothetical protein
MAVAAYLIGFFRVGRNGKLVFDHVEMLQSWKPLDASSGKITLLMCSEYGESFKHACNRISARLEADSQLTWLLRHLR